MIRNLFDGFQKRRPERQISPVSFVDIHCHLLPGLDDGPETLPAAIELLWQASRTGTTCVVTTPHGGDRGRFDSIHRLEDAFRELNRSVAEVGPDIQLVLGMEIPLELNIASGIGEGRLLTLNQSRYVLIELPFEFLPPRWEEVLFDVQLAGYWPIIAHPERQAQIQKNPRLTRGLRERGVLLQLTAGSLLGRFGHEARAAADTLLAQDYPTIIASDAHEPSGRRNPSLDEALTAATKLVGESRALDTVSTNPRAIVEGRHIELPEG